MASLVITAGAAPWASTSRKPPATTRLDPAAILRKSRRRLSEYCHRVKLMITPLRLAPSQVQKSIHAVLQIDGGSSVALVQQSAEVAREPLRVRLRSEPGKPNGVPRER